jgi:ElaB/YqjD/DUF883 family membrane-anchored ribosome-binding protein
MNAAVAELFDGVDDLIRRVADTECPEIRKARARVHAALVLARNASEKMMPRPVERPAAEPAVEPAAATRGDDDSHGQDGDLPPQTLGVALLLGLGLGLMTHSRQ